MIDEVYQQININNEYHQQQIQYQNQFYVYGYTYYNPYFNLWKDDWYVYIIF